MLTVLKGSHYFADAFIGEYTVRRSSRAQPVRTCPPHHAGVAELVDAPDSKSGFLTEVRVRFPLPAPLRAMVSARFEDGTHPLLK